MVYDGLQACAAWQRAARRSTIAPQTLAHLVGGRRAVDLAKASCTSAGMVLLEDALGMRPSNILTFSNDLPRCVASVRSKHAQWAGGDSGCCELSAALAQLPASAANSYT